MQETNLHGKWQHTHSNMSLAFFPNKTYRLINDQGIATEGIYSLQGQQLQLYNPSLTLSLYYQLYLPSAGSLVLIDMLGTQLQFEKANAYEHQLTEFNGKVMAEKNGFQLKEDHLAVWETLLQFMLMKPLSDGEKQTLAEKIQQDFVVIPEMVIKDAVDWKNRLDELKKLANPVQVGIIRHDIITDYYLNDLKKAENERSYFYQLLNKYVPVISYDKHNRYVFTQRDFDSWVEYSRLVNEIYDIDVEITPQQIEQTKTQIRQNYLFIPLEQKQAFSIITAWNLHVQQQWQSFSAEEKVAVKRKCQQPPQPTYSNEPITNAEYMNYLANMQQLASMQNMLNGMAYTNMYDYTRIRNMNENFATDSNIRTQYHWL